MQTVLSDLIVLVLDCQATCANPEKGHLLEIGWAQTSAAGNGESTLQKTETCLCKLPDGTDIPRHVRRITGISDEELASGYQLFEIWGRLTKTAHRIAAANSMELCPAVIHFARYEEPYLRHLHQHISPDVPFPFEILCTHEIAKRLLPDLPRRGIRAVAGYLGYSVDELRRSAHHTAATAYIWRKLAALLSDEHGIHTLEELRFWLANTNASTRSGRAYPMDSRIRLGLPDSPGVYRMLRSNGDVLYVGKAKSLKQRVNSYFQKRSDHSEHILEMLSQAFDVAATVTGSALEAAVLESDTIKRLSPPYNIALRRRNREVYFFSRDLRHARPEADDIHTIGPLPSVDSVMTFPAVLKLLGETRPDISTDENVCAAVLGIPREYIPDVDCFREGFDIFRQRHGTVLNNNLCAGSLSKLGAQLWQERHVEPDTPDTDQNDSGMNDESADEHNGDTADEKVRTPETVADSIESSILHGAHLLRRARWFCLLSESSLVWRACEKDNRMLHHIVFEKGEAHCCGDIQPGDDVDVPPGYMRKFHERQQNFDVTTYDRLRVVTTELRRLLFEGRDVELRVRPAVSLRNEHLERLLRWV